MGGCVNRGVHLHVAVAVKVDDHDHDHDLNLVLGSKLCTRLAAAAPPQHTRMTAIWSRADALVPGGRQPPIPGAEVILYDDLGHVALLGSRRVARDVIERLSRE